MPLAGIFLFEKIWVRNGATDIVKVFGMVAIVGSPIGLFVVNAIHAFRRYIILPTVHFTPSNISFAI
jgi:hypothetical protein